MEYACENGISDKDNAVYLRIANDPDAEKEYERDMEIIRALDDFTASAGIPDGFPKFSGCAAG